MTTNKFTKYERNVMELLYLDGPTFMRELGYYVVFIPSVGLFIASNNLTL